MNWRVRLVLVGLGLWALTLMLGPALLIRWWLG